MDPTGDHWLARRSAYRLFLLCLVVGLILLPVSVVVYRLTTSTPCPDTAVSNTAGICGVPTYPSGASLLALVVMVAALVLVMMGPIGVLLFTLERRRLLRAAWRIGAHAPRSR